MLGVPVTLGVPVRVLLKEAAVPVAVEVGNAVRVAELELYTTS
jgi:hypothetical protein